MGKGGVETDGKTCRRRGKGPIKEDEAQVESSGAEATHFLLKYGHTWEDDDRDAAPEDEAVRSRGKCKTSGGMEIVFLKCKSCPYTETCGNHMVGGESVSTFHEYYCTRCGGTLRVRTRIEA